MKNNEVKTLLKNKADNVIINDKSEDIIMHESFALKKRDKTPPGRLWFSQVTKKFMGVMEAESSYHAMVP